MDQQPIGLGLVTWCASFLFRGWEQFSSPLSLATSAVGLRLPMMGQDETCVVHFVCDRVVNEAYFPCPFDLAPAFPANDDVHCGCKFGQLWDVKSEVVGPSRGNQGLTLNLYLITIAFHIFRFSPAFSQGFSFTNTMTKVTVTSCSTWVLNIPDWYWPCWRLFTGFHCTLMGYQSMVSVLTFVDRCSRGGNVRCIHF